MALGMVLGMTLCNGNTSQRGLVKSLVQGMPLHRCPGLSLKMQIENLKHSPIRLCTQLVRNETE